jgi:hypothetical protein
VDHLARSLGAQALLRGLLLIAAGALIWIGVAFAGYAIYIALVVDAQPAWAAAITASCLLAAPLVSLIVLGLRHPRTALQAPDFRQAEPDTDKTALALLAGVAKEKPLLAVILAGAVGAAETLRRRREL